MLQSDSDRRSDWLCVYSLVFEASARRTMKLSRFGRDQEKPDVTEDMERRAKATWPRDCVGFILMVVKEVDGRRSRESSERTSSKRAKRRQSRNNQVNGIQEIKKSPKRTQERKAEKDTAASESNVRSKRSKRGAGLQLQQRTRSREEKKRRRGASEREKEQRSSSVARELQTQSVQSVQRRNAKAPSR